MVAIRWLEAALWERIASRGSLFGFVRVLVLVCWLGQISPCSIEPGFGFLGFLGFLVVPLLWRYSRGLCFFFSMFSFCQLVGILFLHVV